MAAPTAALWSTDAANELVDRVAGTAREYSLDVAIVAVDIAGQVLVVRRAESAPGFVVDTARRKAVTSAAMRMTTEAVARMIDADPVAARAMGSQADVLAVPGAVPVVRDGVCVGAIGVAGGHYSQDQTLADVALREQS